MPGGVSEASMKNSLAAVVLLLACLPGSVAAWEEDVHFGLTMWLAYQAGLSESDAREIARANQGLDDNPATAAVPLMIYRVMLGADGEAEVASKTIHELHFPSKDAPPARPEQREVFPDPSDVRSRVEGSTSRVRIGHALHAFQDTWSHRGVPDIPVRPFYQFRPLFGWGHPRARGGWWRHRADLTRAFPSDAYQMAKETYSLLRGKLPQDIQRERESRDWEQIKAAACDFALLASRAEKQDWFKKHLPPSLFKLVNVSRLSLPRVPLGSGGKKPGDNMALCEPPQAKPPVRGLPPFGPVSLEKVPATGENCNGLRPVLDRFLKQWIVERQIEDAIEVADGKEVEEQLRAWREGNDFPLPDTRDWLRRVLLMWHVEDHGVVEALGHGYPYVPTYPRLPRTEGEATESVALRKDKYKKLEEAIASPGDGPYAVVPIESGLCVSYLRFRSLHRDVVAIPWSRKTGQWKLVGFQWVAL